MTPKQLLEEQIDRDLKSGKPIQSVSGAFGDNEDCEGYLDKIVTPPEGGTYVQWYGCTMKFRGYPYQGIVEGIGLAKSMVSALPRKILGKSKYLIFCLGLMYIFARKYFIDYLHSYALVLVGHTIWKIPLPWERYNRIPKELKRSADVVLDRIIKRRKLKGPMQTLEDGTIVEDILKHHWHNVITKREIYETIALLLDFVYLFIEYDNAYRFRLQDIAPLVNKQKIAKGGLSLLLELNRMFKLMVSRENPEQGIDFKWREIKWLLLGALAVNSQLREFAKEWICEMRMEEIEPDDDDYYFMLRRRTYNFFGKTYAERLQEWKRINREKGHFKVQVYNLEETDYLGNKMTKPAFKVADWE